MLSLDHPLPRLPRGGSLGRRKITPPSIRSSIQSQIRSSIQSQTDRPSDAAPALIEIKFADPRIPEIHVSGAAASDPTPYGVYLSEDEQAAHDHAAAMAPPPDPNLYALQWESHEGLDSQREGLAGEELAADHLGWGWNLPSDSDFYLFRPFFWRESARPTPPDAHATFNITEYNAALGEWRRAQERAARHETQKKVR